MQPPGEYALPVGEGRSVHLACDREVFLHTLPKRIRAALVFGLAVAGLLAAPMTGFADDLPVLKLAVADGTINPTPGSVLRLAAALGFYEKHGVKVEIVELQGTPEAAAALRSGAVDLADIGIDAAIRLRADNDVLLRGVVASGIGSPFLVAAKDEIKAPADLAGRAYAVADSGSLDQTLTRAWLTSLGMNPDTPAWVPIGPPATRVQALAAGKVDATTVSFGTFLTIAETPGIHILVDPEEFGKAGPQLSKFVAALEPTLASKKDAIQHFTDALVDAARTLSANPDQWVTAMKAARDDLKLPALEKTAAFFARAWCVNGCMNHDMLGQAVDYLYSTPDFAGVKKIGVDDLVDLSFVKATVAAAGPQDGSRDTP